ncbi:MAG: putative sulfate exporter family transporter [Anaerolineales bacterium]
MNREISRSSKNWLRISSALLLTALLSILAWWLTKRIYALTLPGGIPGKVLEYPIWAALLGILVNLLLRPFGGVEFMRPGVRTELFLKIGLVLLGASINLQLLVTAAGGAIVQALILITCVFLFTYWLAGRFGLDDKLRAVMSTALAVCGVSAAIAAAGSVMAKKEQVTYVVALVIVVALPMMVLMPLAAGALGLSDVVAGAWFGGNIDTTAAVIGAGTIYSEGAQQVASIVKNTQNALIGVVAFVLAVYYAGKAEGGRRPSARLIWDRFPKFVLGFIVASILYTLGWLDSGKDVINALRNWAFTLAFVSMGLEFAFGEIKRMGWKPAVVFLLATLFNTLLALAAAWLIFTSLLPISL